MKFGIGQSVARREDDPLIRGEGEFSDDLSFENQAYGLAVRAPYAHAKITSLKTAEAEAAPGVLCVLTHKDLPGKRNLMPTEAPLAGRWRKMSVAPDRRVLAAKVVRHVGEAVAFIVAETLEAARDAAELIEVDYDPLDAIVDTEGALSPGAPQVSEDIPGNLSLDWETGDLKATEAALKKAAYVVTLKVNNNRIVVNAIEPRVAIGTYDKAEGYGLYTPTQGVWGSRDYLAREIFECPHEKIKVITGDVGGGFGMKALVYPEQIMVMAAAEKLRCPVRWTQERMEAFTGDSQGRDVISTVTMGFDEDAKILGYKVESIANFGAYLSQFAAYIPTMAALQVLGGVYRVPTLYVNVKCVLTNTPVVDAYRGAGRPEAAYMLERLINRAAAELGLTQDEIRRRNFIPTDAMPYRTATATVFDSGNFLKNMEDAMKNAGWTGFAGRKAASAKAGKLRGIGMAYYIECTLGSPSEEVTLEFTDDSKVLYYVGTQTNGQGHLTTFSQIIAERLGIPIEAIELVQGDSTLKHEGGGTGGSRSLQMIGNAAHMVTKDIVEKGKRLARDVLEAPNIDFKDGLFVARGTNRSIAILELAEKARILGVTLTTTATYNKEAATFPNGCHIAEVEIDPETGVVEPIAYTVVDDFGVVINPMVVEGQVHGGVVQGLGQALTEFTVFEEGTGQILSGSFMDYGLPRADNIPPIHFSLNEVPCQTNPLGIKGCGEAGTIGACPAIMNAVVDALSEKGIDHIDMPATPHRVWQALQGV